MSGEKLSRGRQPLNVEKEGVGEETIPVNVEGQLGDHIENVKGEGGTGWETTL